MKRTTKKILSLVLVFVFALSLQISAFGYYYESYAHKAPGGTAGTWVDDTNIRNLTATNKPVTASAVGFFYNPSSLKSLPSTFSTGSRTFKMYMMEDDVGDNDDMVKYYTGTFSGRSLTEITYDHTATTGSIEDMKGVELYIRQYVGTNKGDSAKNYTTLFSFYFGVK